MSQDNVQVSVIMAVYNSAKMVGQAIESILNQTFADFEFIICDDCSDDDTYRIVTEYAQKDNRIVLLRNEKNMRAAATRNRCIDKARGNYIAVMDDDDISYPERFERQVDFLNKNPEYDFVSTGVDIFDGEKITSSSLPKKSQPQKEDFLWGVPFAHPTTIFRAIKLREVGCYRVSRETCRGQDFDLFLRMYAVGMKGYILPASLHKYYVSYESMKKRKYKYRLDEAVIRYKGFKALGLLPGGYIYVAKPLIVGLMPKTLLYKKLYK